MENTPPFPLTDNNYEVYIAKLIHTAGKLKLKPDEQTKLYKEIEDADILIKKDGTVFAPWTVYSKRLNDAFTGLGWAMIPQGNPIEKKGFIYWGFHLIIRGCYCGFAYGHNEYSGEKDFLTWGNAIEGAKSNALMRLCKELGIGHKLWDKKFIEAWMAKNAHQDRSGEWKMGPPPEGAKAAPFDEPALDKKLTPITDYEALKKEWEALDEDIQRLPRAFQIFQKHIARVKAIPKKIEKIYSIESNDQQRAIQDYIEIANKYTTAVEIEQNLEADLKEMIEKGLLKENSGTIHETAKLIVNNKRMHLKGRAEKVTA